ncbi:MAG TPA: histidine kinase dimerization/phosphoacceptor domain -containing protein [Rhizomicrobium sp.]
MKDSFDQIEAARSLAQIIVGTVREPLLILDGDLNVLFASTSFYRAFETGLEDIRDRQLFALDDGAWDIPGLRALLADIAPENTATEGFEIAHDFPRIGRRTMLICARKARYESDTRTAILLSFEDVTERRGLEREKEHLQQRTDELLQQKEVLLEEMQHRIVNSLQIIASILMLKARAVTSEETRRHLQDAHRRVMSVAAVQRHLHTSGRADLIEVAPYLSKLCESLAESMIGDSSPAKLIVIADTGSLASADAVSIGLVVTELVINALKYAFPTARSAAEVVVRYEVNGTDWQLSVCDNGVGRPEDDGTAKKGGLGTSLVNALAHQLDAKVQIASTQAGMSVTITHATFTALVPQAA